MFPTLIESTRKAGSKKSFGTGVVSLTLHTAVIAGAVFTTLHAGRSDNSVKVDTTVVLLEPAQQKPPVEQPVQLDVPLKGFQTVVVPPVIPSTVPPVDLQEHFDPKDYSGTGVEGGRASGVVPSDNQVYSEAVVEQEPALLSGAPSYPALLASAGIQGRVLLEAVIDTTGRVEPKSLKVVQSASPALEQPSRQWALKALFRPARLQGRPVRVLVHLPVDYSTAPTNALGPS